MSATEFAPSAVVIDEERTSGACPDVDICRVGDQVLIDAVAKAPEGEHVIHNPDGSLLDFRKNTHPLGQSVTVSVSTGEDIDSISICVDQSLRSDQSVSASVIKYRGDRSADTAANRSVSGDTVGMGGRNIASPNYAAHLKHDIAEQIVRAADQVERIPLVADLASLLALRLQQELENADSTTK